MARSAIVWSSGTLTRVYSGRTAPGMSRSGEKELLSYFNKGNKTTLDQHQLLAFLVSTAFTIHSLKSSLHWSIISSKTMQSSKPWTNNINTKQNIAMMDRSSRSNHYGCTLIEGWTFIILDGHFSPMSNVP